MLKARIINDVVDAVSYADVDDAWVSVPEGVFAGFTDNGDGTFSAPIPPSPSTNPTDYNLNQFQFFNFLERLGVTEAAVDTAIDSIEANANTRSEHKRRFRHATRYHRDHPLLMSLISAIGKTPAEVDAAWMQAKEVK